MWEWLLSVKPNTAICVPTENFSLFQMAEERHMTVGILLTGKAIPLMQMEFEIYNQYCLAKIRLDQQSRK